MKALLALGSKPAWLRGVLLAVFCALLAGILLVRTRVLTPASADWPAPTDHHKYIYMAEQPLGSFHIAPPNWRVAVPFLVQHLPFTTLEGFKIQAFFFLIFTAVMLYYCLKAAGYPDLEAFLGLTMFWSYGAATKLLLSDPYSPEPATFAVSIVALYLLLKERDVLLALTLALGATVKETIILVIPLIYTIRARRWVDLRLLARTAAIGLPAVAVLAAIRHWIPAYNDVDSYLTKMGPQLTIVGLGTAKFSFLDALQRVTASRLADETPVNMFRELTFGNVGILWLLPFFALRSTVPASATPSRSGIPESSTLTLLLRFGPFLAFTYLGWFMALNGDRRFAYAFPFWIMMSLNGLRSLAASWNIGMVWFIPVFFLQYLLNLLQPLTTVVPADLALGIFLISLGLLYSVRDRLKPFGDEPFGAERRAAS